MKKLLTLLFTILFFSVLPLSSNAASLEEIKDIVLENYVGTIHGDLQNAQTIDEIEEMLDPYSAYFTKEEFQQFLDSVEYTTVGIGVIIQKHEKGILIVQVLENSSAQNAGIVEGDIITEVDGQSIVSLNEQDASSRILGAENTSVTLTILKANGSSETLNIIRKPFSIPNVTSELLYGNVGYIHLSSFSSDGTNLVINAYKQLKNQGAKSFILDLQNNGGGYVSTAEELLGMFPNTYKAFKLQTKADTTIEPVIKQSATFPVKTKLLINRYSASASEMTAAALLDQHTAILYGEKSYGKGSMQTFFEFPDGSYLKLTVGIFSGPKGTVINKVGVMPTIQTTSDPIYRAHFDSIAEQLSNYTKLTSLTNVPTTKTFTVKFNKEVQKTIPTDTVSLVALGSNSTVSVAVQAKGNQLIVTPKEPLFAGGEYMLIVHKKIQGTTGKLLNKGAYLHITVAK